MSAAPWMKSYPTNVQWDAEIVPQPLDAGGVGLHAGSKPRLECRGRAEHVGVEEVIERPQLAEVVLDRGTTQDEPALSLQQHR